MSLNPSIRKVTTPSAAEAAVNYDYVDINEGTGRVNYYAGVAIASGAKPAYNEFENLMIKEMAGNGIRLAGSINIENCSFSNSMVRDCNGHCIYINRANNCDFNNLRVRSAKTGFSGCVVDGSANNSLNFNDCRMEGNNENGLYFTQTGGRMAVNGGSYSANSNKGTPLNRPSKKVTWLV